MPSFWRAMQLQYSVYHVGCTIRITRAEDSLEESRREMLELTEAKAALERELSTLRMQAVEGLDETAVAG